MTASRKYFRVMLGKASSHADECRAGGFIGGHWGFDVDLTGQLPDDWRAFNREFIPVFLARNPDKSKIAAGLACGMLHTICKGIKIGDIILSPNGQGAYYVGDVTSDYQYVPGGTLPHRRAVSWRSDLISRDDMSDGLRNSAGSIGTVSDITKHSAELETLMAGSRPLPPLVATDPAVEDPAVFALEKHLEEFLVHNWACTELGRRYEVYREDGEAVGQQYPTDTGAIDILAVSKDNRELLVVELKKGRASDVVVGQIQRYMGYVLDELAEPGQTVRGIVIAMENDLRLRRALRVAPNIDFYRYQVSFRLISGTE
jgi:restriction system protein